MSRTSHVTLAGLALLFLTSCATQMETATTAPKPNKPIDAARFYRGVWHEIGRRPMALTDGCVAGATEYSPMADGEIGVTDSCRMKTPSGSLKTIGGPGRIIDPGMNAKLRVRYKLYGLFSTTREYWVLDRARDYSWFISADPTFRDLWIFTRRANVSIEERNDLIGRARKLGYDTSKLEFPAQPRE